MANVVDYFEIGSPDPSVSTAFYAGLFGWEIEPPSGPAKYAMVEGGKGGLWDTADKGGASWAIFYVQVDDVQASIDHAVALGATIAIPFTDNGQIHFAHLVDPIGNRFGVWHPKPE
jgi:predicted enzyme related to lactoylglutathione lyase